MKKGKALSKGCALCAAFCLTAGMLSGCGTEEKAAGKDVVMSGSRERTEGTGTAEGMGTSEGTETSGGTDTAGGKENAVLTAVDTENMFTDRDRSGEYTPAECRQIKLDSREGGTVTLTEEGVYLLSGSLENGMVVVDAGETAKVQLVLENVEIKNSGGAAIYVKQADKVFLTLAEGTTNTLSGGESYESLDGNNIDGIIFSKSDLVINGGGSLAVTAVTGHGIVSKDDLKVTGGTVTVSAPGHGLSGKDSVRIAEGTGTTPVTLNITAGKDGIHSGNEEREDKGFVYIEGGTVLIADSYEGIEGNNVLIAGGSIRLHASDDGINCAGGSENLLLISGGSIYVSAQGDGIDSNGSITVTGGEIYISGPESSMDGALDYEGSAQIAGGKLVAVGNIGMAMNFEETSTQGSALFRTSDCGAGTEVRLENQEGDVLLRYTAESRFNSVVVSCPEMIQGETYVLYAGNEAYEVTLESLIYGKGFGGFGGDGGFRGDWGEPPEMPEGEERPEMPWGGELPEMPEGGERPEMPWGEEPPEMPRDGEPPRPTQKTD